jgi:hypothetical protein
MRIGGLHAHDRLVRGDGDIPGLVAVALAAPFLLGGPAGVELSIEPERVKKRRIVDTANRDARLAIAGTVEKFGAWRQELASFAARSARRQTRGERDDILKRCSAIEQEVLGARTDIIVALAEAPRRVAGHSRVVDVERALDNIHSAVNSIRAQIG